MSAETNFRLRLMTADDYEAAFALWRVCDGVGLRGADSRPAILRFLARNPDTCFVAAIDKRIVGTVLASQDGRRGYLYHLAVLPDYRGAGCGRALVERALAAIHACGIEKCHIHVFKDNSTGREFWRELGWQERQETMIMSLIMADDPSA